MSPPSPISRPSRAAVGKISQRASFFSRRSRPVLSNADSGATGNYLALADISVLRNVTLSSPLEQISVEVATGTLTKSTHHGYLDVPGHGAMIAYVFPQLKGSLLSISALVNVGLHVSYCKDFVTALDVNENIIFQGQRDVNNGLWMVDLQLLSSAANTPLVATSAIRLDSVSDFINFWHGAFGSPSLSTFIPAVEKGFINIPGLTAKKIRRHPPNPMSTPAGHLDATRQGVRSTKKTNAPTVHASLPETSNPTPLTKERRIFYRVEQVLSGRAHSDATGAFPARAHSGAYYQIIFFHEDLNFIHVETTKSRSGADLLAALQRAVKFCSARGASPSLIYYIKNEPTDTNVKIVRMDNE